MCLEWLLQWPLPSQCLRRSCGKVDKLLENSYCTAVEQHLFLVAAKSAQFIAMATINGYHTILRNQNISFLSLFLPQISCLRASHISSSLKVAICDPIGHKEKHQLSFILEFDQRISPMGRRQCMGHCCCICCLYFRIFAFLPFVVVRKG